MKKMRLPFVITLIISLLFSCQKERRLQDDSNPGTGTGGSGTTIQEITGDYNFVGLDGDTKATLVVASPIGSSKTVTTAKYTSTDNSGTVKITSNKFIYTDIAYNVNTMAHVQLYLGNTQIGESDAPYDEVNPATSGEESYVKFSSDSITFNNPLFLANNPFGAAVPPTPMGAKLSWKGDTLLLKVKHSFSGTVSQNGTPADFAGQIDGLMKLKKK